MVIKVQFYNIDPEGAILHPPPSRVGPLHLTSRPSEQLAE